MKKEFIFSLIDDDLIVIDVLLNMHIEVQLALDTGCTNTVIVPEVVKELGFNLRKAQNTLINTGSRQEKAKEITLETVEALDMLIEDFPIQVFDVFVDTAKYVGFLGLDFFKDKILTIDFRRQVLTVE